MTHEIDIQRVRGELKLDGLENTRVARLLIRQKKMSDQKVVDFFTALVVLGFLAASIWMATQ